MRFTSIALASSVIFGTYACSALAPTPKAKTATDAGTTSDVTFEASGQLSGAVTATITSLNGTAAAGSLSFKDPFAVQVSGNTTDGITLTSPDPSTVTDFSFGCALGFTSVPAAGTYEQTSAGGMQFDCLVEYTASGATKSTQFGAGTNVTSTADALSLAITSITETTTTSGTTLYAVHGTINALLVAGDGSGSSIMAQLTF